MPTSNATAVWEGGLKAGRGHFKAGSASFEGDYSFLTRFEGARGTNPEELMAAAHAACLSMALSAGLEKGGTPATRISTKASCTIDKVGDGFKITKMRLEVRGKVPGLDQAGFANAAEAAKKDVRCRARCRGTFSSTWTRGWNRPGYAADSFFPMTK
jgi:osmotically inducible protein OsmC